MIKIKINDAQLLVLLAIAGVILFWAANGILLSPEAALDDAYITLHNAQLYLGQKQSSVFGEQSALVGSTSLIHTCLLVLLLIVGLPAEMALAFSSVIGGMLYLLGAAALINLQQLTRLQKIGFLFISFFMALVPYQLTNGLETGLAMAVVIWAIYAFEKGGNVKKFLLPLLLGAMPIIRPELIALAGLIFLILLYEAFKAGATYRQLFINAAMIVALALVALLPFLALSYIDSGTFFPNTINAKKYFFAEGCQTALQRSLLLLNSLSVFALPLFLMLFFIVYLKVTLLGRALLVFMLVFLGAYWINMPGSLIHNFGRYFYVLTPIIFYASLLYAREKDLKNNSHWLFKAVLIQLVFINLPALMFMVHQHKFFVEKNHKGTVEWLKKNTQTTDTILVHDVGYLGYALEDRRVIDIVGLKTREIADVHKNITWASCGKERGRAIAEIVKTYRPNYIVVFSWWDDDFNLTGNVKDVASMTMVKDLEGYDSGYFVYRLAYDQQP